MEDIRAVVFDFDGTIYSSILMSLVRPQRYLYGMKYFYLFYKMRRCMRSMEFESAIHMKRWMHKQYAKALGVSVSTAAIILERCIYRRWEQMLDPIIARRGFYRCISYIKEKGLKLGVLSNFRVVHKITSLHILSNVWDIVCSAEDTGALKPMRTPFQYVSDYLKEKPQHIAFVGDSFSCDVRGAVNAGMQAVYFSPFPLKKIARRVNGVNITHVRSFLQLRKLLAVSASQSLG